jgi:hypothetical protein
MRVRAFVSGVDKRAGERYPHCRSTGPGGDSSKTGLRTRSTTHHGLARAQALWQRPRGTAPAPGCALGGMDGTGLAGASPATIRTAACRHLDARRVGVAHIHQNQKQSAAVSRRPPIGGGQKTASGLSRRLPCLQEHGWGYPGRVSSSMRTAGVRPAVRVVHAEPEPEIELDAHLLESDWPGRERGVGHWRLRRLHVRVQDTRTRPGASGSRRRGRPAGSRPRSRWW